MYRCPQDASPDSECRQKYVVSDLSPEERYDAYEKDKTGSTISNFEIEIEASKERIVEMSEITRVLQQMEAGDGAAAEQFLPLVYNELRRMAAQQLSAEKAGQTLDATALVHEAYLRLVGDQQFENRRHFFAAAAQSMRRILVERARSRQSLKGGKGRLRVDLESGIAIVPEPCDELLALDEALDRLGKVEPQAMQLVQLRYFGGCTMNEAAEVLDMSLRSANRLWAFAKAWLLRELRPF